MFKTRATKLQSSLEDAGFKVTINPAKPRKGSFVVTIVKNGNQNNFIELVNMQRPFTALKLLDMITVAEGIIHTYTTI